MITCTARGTRQSSAHGGLTRRLARAAAVACIATVAASAQADSPYLYGIHWWGDANDPAPATLLDCPQYGGWDVETILTHSDPWWSASHFLPLYQNLYTNKNMTMITRIDYKWGEGVPNPNSPDYANWPTSVVNTVNTLRNQCHLWILGNELNLIGEGNNWPDNHVTPAGYATIYRNVRNAIRNSAGSSPAGPHRLLIAPVSPGGIISGVRWMAGTDWLGQVIDQIPAAEIDGFAIHSYGGSVADFRNGYSQQLAVIDAKGLQSKPVYMTEWNRYSAPGNAAQEAAAAQFCRDAFADVHAWNTTPGKHNIVCMAWFVYASNGWDGYSIQYWRNQGNPAGHPGDLYTAFQETVDLRYPAGAIGLPDSPLIERAPASFSRNAVQGNSPTPDAFTIRNAGHATLNYTISDNAAWLSTSVTSGTSTTETDSITVNYSTSALAPGSYSAVITIDSSNAANAPQTITVDLIIEERPIPGDMNDDRDVDSDDVATFIGCMTGANNGPPDPGCSKADVDGDNDVDQSDFGFLQRCMSGLGIVSDPDCADPVP